jgi:hypothetical protein
MLGQSAINIPLARGVSWCGICAKVAVTVSYATLLIDQGAAPLDSCNAEDRLGDAEFVCQDLLSLDVLQLCDLSTRRGPLGRLLD